MNADRAQGVYSILDRDKLGNLIRGLLCNISASNYRLTYQSEAHRTNLLVTDHSERIRDMNAHMLLTRARLVGRVKMGPRLSNTYLSVAKQSMQTGARR